MLVIGIWLALGSEEESTDSIEAAAPEMALESEPTVDIPAVPTFPVLVEAAPWGEILQIVDDTGQEVPLPEARATPIMVDLPEGSFVISVTDPRTAESSSCEVSVSASIAEPCAITFPPIDPLDYFKDAGWWE